MARRWTAPRVPDAVSQGLVPALRCPEHGKLLYPSRKGAKRAIRTHRRDRAGMREYECADRGGIRQGWHIGHMPHAIRKGLVTARQVYGR